MVALDEVTGLAVTAEMTGAWFDDGCRESVKLTDAPFKLATSIAVVGSATALTATSKLALLAPAGILIDAGMVT
jgi:hypothetical protein